MRVTRHWHRLSREAVESPSSEIVKTQLDVDLASLLLVTLLEERGLVPCALCQPQVFCDSVITLNKLRYLIKSLKNCKNLINYLV